MDKYLEEMVRELDRILTTIQFAYPNLDVTCLIQDPRQATLDLGVEE